MGFPLPTQTLFEVQQKYWQQGDDFNQVTDAERMERQDRAYHGQFKRWLRRTDPQELDHNVTDNRCEPIVATGVDFLLGDEVTFEVMDDTATDENGDPVDQTDEQAQEHLDAVWEANVKMPTLAEEEINKAVFGHGFIKLIPDDADMPLAPNGTRIPALAILNPMQMDVTPAVADIRKVVRYAFNYVDKDPKTRAQRFCRQLTERDTDASGKPVGPWRIVDQVKFGSGATGIAGVLTPVGGTADDPDDGWQTTATTPWNYSWSPIHDGKNLPEPNSYWGKADLRLDIIHLNDALNFMQSNINRILYIHAHPKLVGFGTHQREWDVSPTGALNFANVAARVEMFQITADGIEQARAFVEDIRESMDELSHVPSVAVGRLKNLPGVPSGVALKVAYRPLVSQTLQKRNLRAAVYTKLCQHILELGGFGTDRKIVIHWSEMLPTDELTEAQSALIWKQIGASQDTLLQRGDFDPDVEAAKRAEEAEAAQEQMVAKQQAMQDAGIAPIQPVGAPGQSAGQAVVGEPQQPSPQAGQAPQQPPKANRSTRKPPAVKKTATRGKTQASTRKR